jgi:hypothetical protein
MVHLSLLDLQLKPCKRVFGKTTTTKRSVVVTYPGTANLRELNYFVANVELRKLFLLGEELVLLIGAELISP